MGLACATPSPDAGCKVPRPKAPLGPFLVGGAVYVRLAEAAAIIGRSQALAWKLAAVLPELGFPCAQKVSGARIVPRAAFEALAREPDLYARASSLVYQSDKLDKRGRAARLERQLAQVTDRVLRLEAQLERLERPPEKQR